MKQRCSLRSLTRRALSARRSVPRVLHAAAVAWFICAGCFEPATATDLSSRIAAEVERARRTAPELGVHVVELESGRTIFQRHADRQLIVASNVKLVTTAAALDHLGPDYFFDTPLLMRGEIIRGRLYGDLAIVGSGDPTISGRRFEGDPLAPMRTWARRLRELGIEEVFGRVFLVHGMFDDERVHRDWPADQLSKWYEAPVEALSFSDNCILVRVAPGKVPGSPAMVQLTPDLGFVRIENSAVTTGSARRHVVAVDRRVDSDTIYVSGRVFRESPPVETWVTVRDPVRYFGAALRRAFAEEGVLMAGGFEAVDSAPAGGWRLADSYRSDLLTTLQITNRRSQNMFAESLLKMMGARLCGDGSWSGGLRVLEAFLAKVGITEGYRLVDGSGMSRNNLFTAEQMTRLLIHMASHHWQREFFDTLPYSGLEEHHRWRTRLASDAYRGRVVAKTGSLRGVSTISGFARARSGKTYVFSILCNNVSSVAAGRRAQDRILKAVIDQG